MDLKLIGEKSNRENMIHMDSISSFGIKVINDNDPSTFRPKNLIELIKDTHSISFFFEELKENMWLLLMWFAEY